MLRFYFIAIICGIGNAGFASSLSVLDLVLRVDSIGFESVLKVYEDDSIASEDLGDVDESNAIWREERIINRLTIGDHVSLTADFGDTPGRASNCMLAGHSCSGGGNSGTVANNEFSFSDGAGHASWGDFDFRGSTTVGEQARISFSEGPYQYYFPTGFGSSTGPEYYYMWASEYRSFTVAENRLEITENRLETVPLSSSAIFLIAAIGGLGAMRRISRTA